MIRKRARNLHCSKAARDAIRGRAAAAGKTVSRFLLDPVVSRGREDGVAGLTPGELAELCEGLRAVVAFVRASRDRQEPVAACGGGASPVVEPDGPAQGARVRLSVSATDGEWATVREQAAGRGLSISDFLVGLALPAGSAPGAGPLPALDGAEQREALDAIRHMRGLLSALDGHASLSGGGGAERTEAGRAAADTAAEPVAAVRTGSGPEAEPQQGGLF